MYKYEKIAVNKFGNICKRNKDGELIFKCIKCGREKLYVNTANGLYHCFRCGYKGKLKARTTLSDVKAKYDINTLSNLTTKETAELTLIPFFSTKLTDEQTMALKHRGLTDADIKFYHICGRQEDGRIQIPNYVKGCFTDLVCAWEWDKEKVTSKNPKYLNSEGTKKDNTLFNIYNIEQGVNQIILCEGLFNAITAGRNAVASYGCHLSRRQCQLILDKEPKSILLAYDSDEPGVNGTYEVIKHLINFKYKGTVEYILLPVGVDINDLGHDNFINYVNTHKVLIDLDSPLSIKLPRLLFESNKV